MLFKDIDSKTEEINQLKDLLNLTHKYKNMATTSSVYFAMEILPLN